MGNSGNGRETAAGGVVVRWTGGVPRFLLILDGHGNWGFPKGRLRAGESWLAAARRETGEETGVRTLRLCGDLGEERWSVDRAGGTLQKRCRFYLFETGDVHVVPEAAEGITECRWASAEDAARLLTFDQSLRVLERATAALAPRGRETGG